MAVEVARQEQRPAPHARRRQRGLAAGMSPTNHHNIPLLGHAFALNEGVYQEVTPHPRHSGESRSPAAEGTWIAASATMTDGSVFRANDERVMAT